MNRFSLLGLAATGLVLLGSGRTQADRIYVVDASDPNHGMVVRARNDLTALGHTVTRGGTLGSYAGFDQVWDLRYSAQMNAGDITAMGNFLRSGGRMYVTGEHQSFDGSRNNSLIPFLSGVGAGPITLVSQICSQHRERITAAGQVVNAPNVFADVGFNCSRGVSENGPGFMVTEVSPGSPVGSLVGWNFGQIAGAPDARMLVGFDIEIFESGRNWTQNMATYLGRGVAAVPEPGSLTILSVSVVGLLGYGWRRKKAAY